MAPWQNKIPKITSLISWLCVGPPGNGLTAIHELAGGIGEIDLRLKVESECKQGKQQFTLSSRQ